jgi:hypothetical protein
MIFHSKGLHTDKRNKMRKLNFFIWELKNVWAPLVLPEIAIVMVILLFGFIAIHVVSRLDYII